MLVTSWCWWLTHFVSNTRHQHIDVTGWKLFWLNEYIWPLLWFMRRNLSLNRLCFGDFKNFSSCKNPWVRREDDVGSFFSFGTQSNTQSHCQFLRESCSDFRFGFSGKTVASDRFIQIFKKRDTVKEGYSERISPRNYWAVLIRKVFGENQPGKSQTIHYEFKWFKTKVWLPIRWWIRKLRLSSQVLKSVKHYIRPF